MNFKIPSEQEPVNETLRTRTCEQYLNFPIIKLETKIKDMLYGGIFDIQTISESTNSGRIS